MSVKGHTPSYEYVDMLEYEVIEALISTEKSNINSKMINVKRKPTFKI